MRVLVTGASGFIGRHTVCQLLERGHQVAALTRRKEALAGKETGNLCVLEGSIENPPWTQVEEFSPEACLHCAWITTPGIYLESDENDRLSSASYRFLKRLENLGVRKMVGLGTCIEYDLSAPSPFQEEETPVAPRNSYPRSKVELYERLREDFQPETRFSWARIFYCYGPGEPEGRLISSLIESASQGAPLQVRQIDNVVDYVHVMDVARALVAITESTPRGPINIGSGRGVAVRQVALEISRLMRSSASAESISSSSSEPPTKIVADISKLNSLGWEPLVSVEQGIRGMIERRYPELLRDSGSPEM